MTPSARQRIHSRKLHVRSDARGLTARIGASFGLQARRKHQALGREPGWRGTTVEQVLLQSEEKDRKEFKHVPGGYVQLQPLLWEVLELLEGETMLGMRRAPCLPSRVCCWPRRAGSVLTDSPGKAVTDG